MEKTRSQPHRRVEQILEQEGIAYESEVVFNPYQVDIYLPEFHMAVEIDGPQHGLYSRRDDFRDHYLYEQYGLRIVRIRTSEVQHARSRIIGFIERWSADVEYRKAKRSW